ncbi:uncharacterized protein LOC135950302 [Calliphora vicina]|uniref:uncharacterized protein LOC135950302 n=1 Tax=Calliphora vicina TaxID=7373 RepID=UPI00325BDD05
MSDGKKETLDLIEAYRSLPALWDVKSAEYSDRDKKDEQYNILLQTYKKQNPEGKLADLKKKINVIRTNFRRELRRQNSLEKSGAGATDCFETTLHYFGALSFLRDIETPSESRSTFKREDRHDRKKPKITPADELFTLAADRLREPEDANQHLAKVWAEKLSKINPTQKIFAEKVINDVFLHAQLGLLTFNTNITHTRTLSNIRRTSTPTSSSSSIVYVNNSSQESCYSPTPSFQTFPLRPTKSTIVCNESEQTLLEYPANESQYDFEEDLSPVTLTSFYSNFNEYEI